MGDFRWRAWVGDAAGRKLGAAFLVTPTRLLTCAHTVRGRDEARVGFPGGEEGLLAKVVWRGDWRQAGDLGDVAVLELPEPVSRPAAPFAAPGDLPALATSGREFGVCGFPQRRGDDRERHATVTTRSHWSLEPDWWELRAGEGHALERGYSGSAVYDVETGAVIGMMTNAELRGDRADLGWMMPISRIRVHWEELDDLLPAWWLTAEARRELRSLLADVACGAPLAADVAGVVGRPPAEGFRSAWDAVWYVAEGWPDDMDRLVRFLGRVGRHLPDARRREFDAWTGRHVRAAAEAAPNDAPPSVIVRLERQTFDFDLTVQTWVDGTVGTSRHVEGVPEKGVRRAVETAVAEVAPTLFGREWMIEFAVPEGWLGKPFEEWHLDSGKNIKMRRYPVVVRDVDRLRPDSFRRDQAHHRWRALTERGGAEPEHVRCDTSRERGVFEDRLEADPQCCVLVCGTKPVKPWLTAALNNGIPVMLWTRTACGDASHDDCRGRRLSDELVSAVRGRRPGDLPRVALDLRKKALVAPKDEPHCGRDLTMLWDDPSRLPDPPLAMEA